MEDSDGQDSPQRVCQTCRVRGSGRAARPGGVGEANQRSSEARAEAEAHRRSGRCREKGRRAARPATQENARPRAALRPRACVRLRGAPQGTWISTRMKSVWGFAFPSQRISVGTHPTTKLIFGGFHETNNVGFADA